LISIPWGISPVIPPLYGYYPLPPPVCPPYIGFFWSKRGGDPLNKVIVKKILEKFLGKIGYIPPLFMEGVKKISEKFW
jgi:hypothetical protein